jgi:hypothetical protein
VDDQPNFDTLTAFGDYTLVEARMPVEMRLRRSRHSDALKLAHSPVVNAAYKYGWVPFRLRANDRVGWPIRVTTLVRTFGSARYAVSVSRSLCLRAYFSVFPVLVLGSSEKTTRFGALK